MASSPQNVRNELVLSEPRKSSMEWIAEVTELNSHDFVCFCFCGVLDIGELTSWRNPNCYLTQWFITGFFFGISIPSCSLSISWEALDPHKLSLGIFLLHSPLSCPSLPASSRRGAGRLTHTAQPKPDFGTRSNFWQKYNLPWNPHPKSQDLKKNIFL